MADHGYDVADPQRHPLFGGMPAFERLVALRHTGRASKSLWTWCPTTPVRRTHGFRPTTPKWLQPGADRYFFRDGRGLDGSLPATGSRYWRLAWTLRQGTDGQIPPVVLHLSTLEHGPELGQPEILDDFDRKHCASGWTRRGMASASTAHGMASLGLPGLLDGVSRCCTTAMTTPRFQPPEYAISRDIRTVIDEYRSGKSSARWRRRQRLLAEYSRPDERISFLTSGWREPSSTLLTRRGTANATPT